MAIATGAALALGGAALGSAALGAWGSHKAGKQQTAAIEKGIKSQEQLTREGMGQLTPYREAGAGALTGLQSMLNDPAQAFAQIRGSQQYQDALGSASQNAMRYASATGAGGGLQSSGTSNQLAMLAPQLQQQMYQQQFQNRMGLAGLGMGAAQQGANTLSNLGSSVMAANQNIGGAKANATMGMVNAGQGLISDLGSIGLNAFGAPPTPTQGGF